MDSDRCCCCSLRTGILIWSGFRLSFNVVSFISYLILIIEIYKDDEVKILNTEHAVLIFITFFIDISVHITLIIGAVKVWHLIFLYICCQKSSYIQNFQEAHRLIMPALMWYPILAILLLTSYFDSTRIYETILKISKYILKNIGFIYN